MFGMTVKGTQNGRKWVRLEQGSYWVSFLVRKLSSVPLHLPNSVNFLAQERYILKGDLLRPWEYIPSILASRNKDKCQNYSFIVPVLRLLLNKYREKLPLNSYIPSFPAPDTGHSKFDEELLRITSTEEFAALMKQQIFPSMKQFEANIEDASMDSGRFWMQCLNKLNSSMQEKEEAVERSIKKFQEQIKQPFELLQKQERSQFKIYIKQEKQAHALTLRQWSAAKKYFTSERGAWASRATEPVHWKLSTSENFSRMRLKLTRNYKFDPHKEASAMRDNALAVDGVDGEITIPAVAKEAVVQKLQDDQLDQENWDAFITNTSPRNRSETLEKDQPRTVLEVDCEIITLMDHIPGTFRVTHNHVYFTHTDENGQDPGVQDFKWTLSQLREVHLRRYNLRRSALEFFLIDQTSYFINFTKETRNVVYWKIMTLKPANLYFSKARSPADLLKGSGLTEKWTRREISNFDYLMHLNTIAGRTYNDLSQYPVFPWILADYTSETLDLTNPAVFRDLSKPIGALNADRREELRERYNSFEDPSGVIRKFHYGTHYSNAASVLFFLLRVEPFTTLHIKLQSGRFDVADRQFHSLPEMWQSLVRNPSDVKELIPEFFYFPEMLENSNRFDLGTLQRGGDVDDVILPKWANSAWDFVNKHRQALESDYVSDHLHEWIDLIFGYKQKGPAAEEALNVFYYCTYEGAVDLDAISDAHEREVAEAMINNFGQTPSQLLIVPHPQRMNADQATEARAKLSGDKPLTSLFTNLEHIKKAYEVDVFSEHQPLVLVSVPRAQARSLIHHGMLDTMVTINQQGITGAHGWLPYRTRTKHFTFEPDPSLSSSRSRRCVAPFLSPDLQVTSRLFLVTHDAKLVISCGHWDNSIRVFNIKGKLQSIIARHSNIVTCLALDDTGHHMISGSRDTTCMVWKIHHYAGMSCNVNTRPVHILYGHDDEVTCVVISWELDIAVSGSKDGTCCIHTVRKGQYVRTLRPIVEQQAAPQRTCEVRCLALSEDGNIVVYCKSNGQLSLTRYSINGKLLDVDFLTENIADMLIQGGYLIIGGQKGKLTFLNLHGLKKARKHMNMHSSICSLFMTTEHSHLLVGLMDGKLHIITSNST